MSTYALSAVSRNLKEASLKTRRLYRQTMKEIPSIVRAYQLELTTNDALMKIKNDFKANRHVTDPHLIDVLVFKGTLELEEAKELHMTKAHVMNFFQPDPKFVLEKDKTKNEDAILEDFFNPKTY